MSHPHSTSSSRSYAIMNYATGRYLSVRKHHSHIVCKHADISGQKDEVLDVPQATKHSSGYYEFDLLNTSFGGPSVLDFRHNASGTKLEHQDLSKFNPTNDAWLAHPHNTGAFEGFCRIQHKQSQKYMQLSDDSDDQDHHYVESKSHHDHPAQFWQFVEVGSNDSASKIHNTLLSAVHKHDGSLAPPPAKYAGGRPERYTPTNGGLPYKATSICGDPNCGITFICNADYARICTANGYSEVNGQWIRG